MKIRLFGIANDSIVDGEGLRMTIFTQGCPHNCPGCHNPDSHSFDGGKEYDTDEIISMLDSNPLLDGITLSGGEPFIQISACTEIAKAARERGLNVWCYSGYTYEELVCMVLPWRLLQYVDVLVDGRFDINHRSLDLYFRGSRNQRVIDMRETLKQRKIVLYHD
jgi:anaerobic ribonucleoside-triphosphate reductase activating protein